MKVQINASILTPSAGIFQLAEDWPGERQGGHTQPGVGVLAAGHGEACPAGLLCLMLLHSHIWI